MGPLICGFFFNKYGSWYCKIHRWLNPKMSNHGFCCCSVSKLWLTLCNPIDCRMAGFPVLHYLPEFAQTHVHWVMMPSNHLILYHPPLLLLPSILPSIRVFSNEFALSIRWPKYSGTSASASVLPMNIQDWFLLGLTGLISLLSKGLPSSLLQHHHLTASTMDTEGWL